MRGPLAGWRFPQQKARTFTHLLKLLEAEGVDDIGVGRGQIFPGTKRLLSVQQGIGITNKLASPGGATEAQLALLGQARSGKP